MNVAAVHCLAAEMHFEFIGEHYQHRLLPLLLTEQDEELSFSSYCPLLYMIPLSELVLSGCGCC